MGPGTGSHACGARAGLTLCPVLQRVQLLLVGGRVDVDCGDACGQAQVTLARGQDGHLQHGVHEGHPVVLPEQLACVAWGEGAVGLASLGLFLPWALSPVCPNLGGPLWPPHTRQQELAPKHKFDLPCTYLRSWSPGHPGSRGHSCSPEAVAPYTRHHTSGGWQLWGPWGSKGPCHTGCQRAWGQDLPTGIPSLWEGVAEGPE